LRSLPRSKRQMAPATRSSSIQRPVPILEC
jgi:hypothetical protein